MSTYELMPGDVAVGHAGDQLKTLLGSCVSVILTDPRRTIGVMCHIVHAGSPKADQQYNTAYGAVAMAEMAHLLRQSGFSPQGCQAYVVGGGNMFSDFYTSQHVGARNAEWVLNALAQQHIQVLQQDLGGNTYRKLVWTVGPQAPQVEAVVSTDEWPPNSKNIKDKLWQ